MGRPRFRPVRNTLAAIAMAGAMFFIAAAPAAATSWQKSWGDYDNAQQWHDVSWWLHNQPAWVASHHPEWTENYATTRGQIGDSDRFHGRHYGDGGTDRSVSAALEAAKNDRLKASKKTEASVKNAS